MSISDRDIRKFIDDKSAWIERSIEKEMNHSNKFWSLVEQYCPEYEQHKRWLKEHGNELIGRLE